MKDLLWAAPEQLGWIALAGAPVALAFVALRVGAARSRRIAADDLRDRMGASSSRWPTIVRSGLASLAIAMVVLAMARPVTLGAQERVERPREVCLVVDVSRSMLAIDQAPTRLERARSLCAGLLDSMPTGRVGLVAFAGSSTVRAPLTADRSFLRLALDELSPRAVSRGGTRIAPAIDLALRDVLEAASVEPGDGPATLRDLIVLTDGEEHEPRALEAAERAGALGVRVIAVGLGTPDPIAVPGRTRAPEGGPAMTALREAPLERLALATPGGQYRRAEARLDLGDLVLDSPDPREAPSISLEDASGLREWGRVPLAAAMALLLVRTLVGERRRA